jgi:hypothetical protein
LFKERSSAHLIVTSFCTVSIRACSKDNDAEFEKIRGTEVYTNAAEIFLYEFTRLSERNVDHAVYSDNYMQLTGAKFLIKFS